MDWNSTKPATSFQLDTQPIIHDEKVEYWVANANIPVISHCSHNEALSNSEDEKEIHLNSTGQKKIFLFFVQRPINNLGTMIYK